METRAVPEFLKTYAVFLLFALAVNLVLEILLRFVFEIPETPDIPGITFFYVIFSVAGTAVFLHWGCRPLKMGATSLVAGQFLEFAFMRPEWVQNIYAFRISGDAIGGFAVSSLYWFAAWLIPAYAIRIYGRKGNL